MDGKLVINDKMGGKLVNCRIYNTANCKTPVSPPTPNQLNSPKMKALILNALLRTATVQDIPLPVLAPLEILIRVHYMALNPVDALYTFHPLGSTGRIIGSDFAGVVEALGADVAAQTSESKALADIQPGVRVAGFLQGACSANGLPGAFAEYITVPFDLVWRVPDSMSLAQASTVSLCALTAAQGLFYRLGLPAPWKRYDECEVTLEHENAGVANVFVYGASTSVGLYAA